MPVKINRKKKGKKTQKTAKRPPVSKQEVSALGQAIRSLGTAIGGAGGAMIGMPTAGGVIGNSLAGALSRWLGAGDYSINDNTVLHRTLKAASSIPSMHADAQSIVVRHKEYLGEVKSSQTFAVQQSFPLNPGLSTTFPWLSGIAARFQEYRIRGLVFHYIPTSGHAVSGTNAALGSVMLQTSYRSNDAAPGSKVEFLNEYCSNEVIPSEAMAHPIECDPKENPFNVQYVRTGAIPAGDTPLMYDLGVTHVAVSGCLSATPVVLGDLWVTYDIELKKPLVASNVTANVVSASGLLTLALSPAAVFGTTAATLLGNSPIVAQNNTLTFPKGTTGQFAILVWIQGTSLALTLPSLTYSSAAGAYPIQGDSIITLANGNGTTLVSYYTSVLIVDPSVNATVTFNFGGTGTLTSTRIAITEIL